MAEVNLRRIVKKYDEVEAVRGIDLDIADHEFVVLVGPSGCGKTTTLRMIAGFVEPSGGEIRVGDRVLSSPARTVPPERRNMSMIFQSYALWPHMTVAENVAYGLELRKIDRATIKKKLGAILDTTHLGALAERYPDRLSGGQQQRVAIVRALAMQPRLLLLDEITSALDPELVSEVLNIVRELAAEGMTMLLATHEMSFAREVSSKVCFLDAGVICEEGPPEQIFGEPQNERTRIFLKRIIEAGRL
ncbi:MAG: amino acid ABC transporter ATP-binding protein [Burkholderiales bacterium]